jgi:hypothetical protein
LPAEKGDEEEVKKILAGREERLKAAAESRRGERPEKKQRLIRAPAPVQAPPPTLNAVIPET